MDIILTKQASQLEIMQQTNAFTDLFSHSTSTCIHTMLAQLNRDSGSGQWACLFDVLDFMWMP